MSTSKSQQLKDRTEAFAIGVAKLCRKLPLSIECRRITPQLIDAANSVGSNYRASCRARSRAEFTAKIGVVAEEADESEYWLGLLLKLEQGPSDELETWRREADELTAIFTASFRTARSRR